MYIETNNMKLTVLLEQAIYAPRRTRNSTVSDIENSTVSDIEKSTISDIENSTVSQRRVAKHFKFSIQMRQSHI